MRIKKSISVKELQKNLVIFLFFYSLFIQGLMSLLNLPQIVLYVKDVVLILCVILCGYNRHLILKKNDGLNIVVFILLLEFIFSSLAGNVPFLAFFVALRKFFRGFLYMYLCVDCLNELDVNKVIHACYNIQILNLVFIFIQRVIMGYKQDYSNGIFGSGLTNNFTSVFCLILVCYCTAEFIYGNNTLKKWILQIAVNFAIAIVAELKILFILIPIAIVLILREKLFSKRGMKLSLLLIIGVICALIVFGIFYQDQIASLITISGMKNYNDWGLATHAAVDRKNWLNYTIEHIFGKNRFKRLFGIGFGEITGLSSSTIDIYGYKSLGYGAYSASTLFLETGLCGLILVVIWFLINIRRAFFIKKNAANILYHDFAKGFIPSMVVFLVYANILYNDSSYLAFFAFSFLYIKNSNIVRGNKNVESRNCYSQL